MATLAEKIAAKRLAATAPSPAEMVFDIATSKEEQPDGTIIPSDEPKEVETAVKAEPVPLGKPLTFMEQMALKKAQKESTSTPVNASAQTVKNTETQLQKPANVVALPLQQTTIAKEEQAINVTALAQAVVKLSEVSVDSTEPDLTDVPMVDQQAYRDIKAKLDLLEDMAEVNLKDAMTDLKKALLKNPQACYLILPQDVGQMVVALRRMKNEDVVTAEKVKKEPGAKRAKASKALTADEIATAFDEL